MSEEREAYDQYMNAGHDAAWDQDWAKAIQAYRRAISELPEDAEAHIYLGTVLLNGERFEDALKVFKRAYQLAPDDPIPLEKSADVLERMGRLKEAAQQYVNVSEIYMSQGDLNKAIDTWERATQLTPGLVAVHARLARAYERIGDKKKAIHEYLTLAFNFRRMEETEKAIKAVERALRLNKRHAQALNILRALRAGEEIRPIEDDEDEEVPEEASDFDIFQDTSDVREEVGEAHPLGPIGEAMDDALGLLAGFVMETGTLDASRSDAMQALEFQRQELIPEAIEAYQHAEAKLRHPALKLNLGGLLLLNDRPDEAVKHLGEAVMDPQLSAGAYHGLGQAYFQLGDQKKAVRYLIRGLQAVDTNLAVSQDEVAELTAVYDRVQGALDGRSDEALTPVNERFISLLGGADWKQRIAETRRHLEEIIQDQGEGALVDFLETEGADELAELVAAIDRYIRQNLLTLAMDEAHYAVEKMPTYLPIHVRMAEIMMREGRIRQAINKYNMVAKSYMVRGEKDRSASILGEVLEMAPLDVNVRSSLISLLEEEERWDDVLEQYVGLADTYHQLGNFDLTRSTYARAEQLANKTDAPVEKRVEIKHHIADLDQMRLNTRGAQKMYEEILVMVPEDEKAHRMLIDLYYNQGNQVEAVKRLDRLLGLYAKQKQINRITLVLEELVKHYPNDAGLRSRLSQIYKRLGRKRDAIEQLDALGELQIEAGLHEDAVDTIRRIITLEPEHVEDYERLLEQLGGA